MDSCPLDFDEGLENAFEDWICRESAFPASGCKGAARAIDTFALQNDVKQHLGLMNACIDS